MCYIFPSIENFMCYNLNYFLIISCVTIFQALKIISVTASVEQSDGTSSAFLGVRYTPTHEEPGEKHCSRLGTALTELRICELCSKFMSL